MSGKESLYRETPPDFWSVKLQEIYKELLEKGEGLTLAESQEFLKNILKLETEMKADPFFQEKPAAFFVQLRMIQSIRVRLATLPPAELQKN